MKKDSIITGIVIGIVAPFIGIYLFYLWKARSARFADFLDVVLHTATLLTAAISFALLANAAAFTIALNTKKDKTAKGIFATTLVLAIPAILYKIFG
ncbi:hypothetical protein I5907_19145 [Panacibacter sp. DH6]|uniref:Uncharacterized protein n=1 Tax=Panacibacter microcysteis TaxID=2793269 RepID=A0A931GZW4_9BACT|nr:hypothetical protein [Panacibacter microcysteis]MBG9378363.1 hypothetical protein [Panacibacter microcysteis]